MKRANNVLALKKETGELVKSFIVAEDADPPQNYIYIVEHERGINALGAIREAVRAFLKTKEGKRVMVENNGFFNWGDAVVNLPTDILSKHGVASFESLDDQEKYSVSHNEDLTG